MIDNLTPSWISFFGNICVLPSNSDDLSFWGCSMTIWSMTSSFTNSARFLKLLRLFIWNGLGTHHDILIWFELYHGGCMQFFEVRGTKSGIWQMLVNKPTRQMNVYLWQRHCSSWCLSETWLDHITMVSHLQSHLLIHLSSLFWNPWQNSIFPIFIACLILSAILTTSCQSSNVVVVVWGLFGAFQQLDNLGNAQKLAALSLPTCGITHYSYYRRNWWIWNSSISSLIPHWRCSKQTFIGGILLC
jgi:hypothetical protein